MKRGFPASNCCKNGRNGQLLLWCTTSWISSRATGVILRRRLLCKGGNDWKQSSLLLQVSRLVVTSKSTEPVYSNWRKRRGSRALLRNASAALTSLAVLSDWPKSKLGCRKNSSCAVSPKEKEAASILERYFWARIEGASSATSAFGNRIQ
jgi:hypothetical protein